MQRPNYALLSCVVVLAVLVGIIGGGLAGGFAGYYVAQTNAANVPVPVSSSSPTSTGQSGTPGGTTNLTLKEDSAVVDAVNKVKPAVVTIINSMQSRRGFFGSTTPTASGSGVIVDPAGYIITNNHVIEGEQSLQVIYSDGTKVSASVVGGDPIGDIAVIKVDGKVPAVAQLADSNALQPGQVAIVIGSPLGDYRDSVTVGVVSGVNRTVGQQQDLIQTDAAINNGNSGGPLLNSLGQVIGITTLVVRSTNDGNVAEGLGFAIPSNQVRQIMSQLIATGRVDRPYIGVTYQELDAQLASAMNLTTSDGVVITQVQPGTPAAQAGLVQGDVITQFDSQAIDPDHTLATLLFTRKVGDTVTLIVVRDGKPMQVKLTLVARPTS